jgi:hypothetical protein
MMTETTTDASKIAPNEKGNPPGKLAEAELYFEDGPLAGTGLSVSQSGSVASETVATSPSLPQPWG